MMRLSVEVINTTIEPRQACTKPSRMMSVQPKILGMVVIGRSLLMQMLKPSCQRLTVAHQNLNRVMLVLQALQ